MYKLVALDVDGTLLNSHHELTPAVAEAIRAALAQDVHVVLATGKQYSAIIPLGRRQARLPSKVAAPMES